MVTRQFLRYATLVCIVFLQDRVSTHHEGQLREGARKGWVMYKQNIHSDHAMDSVHILLWKKPTAH